MNGDEELGKGSVRDRLLALEMGQRETHRLLKEQNRVSEAWQAKAAEDRAELRALITGDGGAKNIGLAGRVDRIEQREESRARMTRMTLAAALLAIFTEAASFVHQLISGK